MSFRPLSLACAVALLGAPFAGQPASSAPPTQLYIDVATHAMPGMPDMGPLGRMAMGAFGGRGANTYGQTRFPALPGQYLDIALYNGLNPGKEATQQIPAGLKLGDSLPLVPPREESRSEPGPGGDMGRADGGGQAKILIYWGCGTEVRPGQPRVVEIDTREGKLKVSGSMQGRYVPDRDARVDPRHALWPNPRSNKRVPDGASLVGDHRVLGDKVPESLKFALDQGDDFLPKIALSSSGDLASGTTWRWPAVSRARGYFLAAMGTRDDALVLWSSSETPDAGMGLVDYLPNATVDKWVEEKVLLPPTATSCAMPKGIFADAGGRGGGMLQMIAYGPERNIAWPPKPASAKAPWNPEWNVRVRTKSTAMAMLGMTVTAGAQEEDADPGESKAKKLLKGLFGH
ncbi:MAG: hypothetical protein ACTHKZ_08775 [Lysobacteraceae bacterium]